MTRIFLHSGVSSTYLEEDLSTRGVLDLDVEMLVSRGRNVGFGFSFAHGVVAVQVEVKSGGGKVGVESLAISTGIVGCRWNTDA